MRVRGAQFSDKTPLAWFEKRDVDGPPKLIMFKRVSINLEGQCLEPLIFFTDNVNQGENKHVSAQQSEAGYKGISFGFLRGKHHLVVKK